MIRRKRISKNKFKYWFDEKWVTFEYLYKLDYCAVDRRCLSGRINNYFNQEKRYSDFGDLMTMITTKKCKKSQWTTKERLTKEQLEFNEMMKLLNVGSLYKESLPMQSKCMKES